MWLRRHQEVGRTQVAHPGGYPKAGCFWGGARGCSPGPPGGASCWSLPERAYRVSGPIKAILTSCNAGPLNARGAPLRWSLPTRQFKRDVPELLEKVGAAGGFQVLPKRGIVERVFSWLERQRRLSKDYGRLIDTVETRICLTGMHLLVARLTQR
jgi:hypothetical protein